jgi:hypothetical protein
MAKRLFTTVVLTDDKGVTHTFSPQEELPDWATEFLEEGSSYRPGCGLHG